MTELSDLLQEAMRRGVTVPKAHQRILDAGLKANRSQLYKAVNGDHAKRVTEPILEAWSVGFGIDIKKLRRANGSPLGEGVPFEPHPLANQMNKDQRRVVNAIIRLFVEASGADITALEDDDVDELGLPYSEQKPV